MQNILDQNIAKWALFSSITDVSPRRALKCTHFVRTFEKPIREKVEKQTGKTEETKKVGAVSFPTPPLTLSSSETSNELRKRQYKKHSQDIKIEEDKPRKHKHRPEGRKEPSSSEARSIRPLTSPFLSDTESFLNRVIREKHYEGKQIDPELPVLQHV